MKKARKATPTSNSSTKIRLSYSIMADNTSARTNAKWDNRSKILFVDLCEQEIQKGNRPNTYLSIGGWKNVVQGFNDATGRKYKKKQMKNHWDSMKKEWSLFKQLLRGETGLGWDETKKEIVADDDWWERKIKENVGYKKFKDKDLSLIWFRYNALFSDVVATGERARAATQEQMSGVGVELLDEEENNVDGHLSDESDDDDFQKIDAAMFPNSSVLKKKSTDGMLIGSQVKKRKTKRGGAAALKEDIHSLIDVINRKSIATVDVATEDTIEMCINKLEKLPGISKKSGIYNYSVNMFMKKEFRQAFLSLTPEETQQSWLEFNYQMFLKN